MGIDLHPYLGPENISVPIKLCWAVSIPPHICTQFYRERKPAIVACSDTSANFQNADVYTDATGTRNT